MPSILADLYDCLLWHNRPNRYPEKTKAAERAFAHAPLELLDARDEPVYYAALTAFGEGVRLGFELCGALSPPERD